MPKAEEILQKYWKHDQFRTLQKEIIDSVLVVKILLPCYLQEAENQFVFKFLL
jgi:superfamily II DNA helicase RecQ